MLECKDQVFESKDKVIVKIMREKILTGEFSHREKLPSVIELAKSFKVSVNIIIKAVNRLKKEDLVIAKPGKGLFRKRAKQHIKPDIVARDDTVQWHYNIATRKKIKIFLEDTMEWQLKFWHDLFADISAKNIDLHLEAHSITETCKASEMNMYIGGFNSLNNLNISADNWLTVEKLREFGSLNYKGMNILPEDISFLGESFAMPIANTSPCLWGTTDKILEINESENVLDFIEQASLLNKNSIHYQIWTGGFLLSNCGCDFLKPFVESGKITETKRFHEILPTLRKYFLSKQLIWQHGSLTNSNDIFGEIKSGRLDAVETPPQMRHIKPPKGIKKLSYPRSIYFPISPIVCLVNKKCSYLEETTRLISSILEENNQYRLSKAVKFDSIHPKVNNLGAKKIKKINLDFPAQWVYDDIYSVFSWELYYYLSKKDQSVDSFISTVNRKIRHCLNVKQTLDKAI